MYSLLSWLLEQRRSTMQAFWSNLSKEYNLDSYPKLQTLLTNLHSSMSRLTKKLLFYVWEPNCMLIYDCKYASEAPGGANGFSAPVAEPSPATGDLCWGNDSTWGWWMREANRFLTVEGLLLFLKKVVYTLMVVTICQGINSLYGENTASFIQKLHRQVAKYWT